MKFTHACGAPLDSALVEAVYKYCVRRNDVRKFPRHSHGQISDMAMQAKFCATLAHSYQKLVVDASLH